MLKDYFAKRRERKRREELLNRMLAQQEAKRKYCWASIERTLRQGWCGLQEGSMTREQKAQ